MYPNMYRNYWKSPKINEFQNCQDGNGKISHATVAVWHEWYVVLCM